MRYKLSLTKLACVHLKRYHNKSKITNKKKKGKGKVSFRNPKPSHQVHKKLKSNSHLGFVLKKAGPTLQDLEPCLCSVCIGGGDSEVGGGREGKKAVREANDQS